VKERILIVGDDAVLLRTRSCLLQDWQITTASCREAEKAIKAQAYDLMIFGQTVPDETAKTLIAVASELHPPSSSLLLCSAGGQDRCFGSASYKIDLRNPGGFRAAVEKLLDSRSNRGVLCP